MTGLKKTQIKERKQIKKENRVAKNLLLLNPGNLAKEVYTYGYHFSWKTHLFVIGACIAGMGVIGLLFQLKWELLVIVLIAMFLALPAFILDTYKKMYEQKRFADAATYMEQMLYAFQKSGKVLSALKETKETFEPGHMQDVIEEAIGHLEAGCSYSEKGVLRESLDIVEKEYECRKIKTLHELLISAEEYGGEADDSISLLLNDVELWKRRGYLLQGEKKKAHTNNVVSIVVATALCAGTLYVLNALPGILNMEAPYNVLTTGLVQVTSFGLLLWMIYVYARSEKTLTRNWLKEESGRDEEYVLRCYEKAMLQQHRFGRNIARRVVSEELYAAFPEWLWAVPFFVAAIYFAAKESWIAIPLFLVTAIMSQQHRFGRNIARRVVSEELYAAFPEWLMQMALLMQHSNVQVSIAKSLDGAPKILVPEINALLQRLKEQPKALSSYTDFCKNFDIPETTSCMKMLYAISESGTGDAKVQIQNLLVQVQEMRNRAAERRNKSSAFQVKMLYSYPVFGASIKLLGDLVVGMMFLFEMLSEAGGM